MGIPNHYDTLGLLPTADDVVIKAAYKALAQKHHPDKHKTHKELHTQRMTEINAAFAILGSKAMRKAYDERLAKANPAPARQAAAAQPHASASPHKKRVSPHAKVIEELSSNLMDEMLVVELFEKLFECKVTIQNGWVNTYSFQEAGKKVSVDFLTLKTRIIHRLSSE